MFYLKFKAFMSQCKNLLNDSFLGCVCNELRPAEKVIQRKRRLCTRIQNNIINSLSYFDIDLSFVVTREVCQFLGSLQCSLKQFKTQK